MVRSTAWLLVGTLVLGSGRLLACDWECGERATAVVEVSCHGSTDSGAVHIGGVTHTCPQEAVEPVVAAPHKGAQYGTGASQALSHSISLDPPSTGRIVSRPLEFRASVRHPLLVSVLRI